MESLLDEEQAAGILTVRVKTLQSWRLRGCGPIYVKLGRCVRYRRSDIEDFVSKRARRSTSDQGVEVR